MSADGENAEGDGSMGQDRYRTSARRNVVSHLASHSGGIYKVDELSIWPGWPCYTSFSATKPKLRNRSYTRERDEGICWNDTKVSKLNWNNGWKFFIAEAG